jgi:acylphosphatase
MSNLMRHLSIRGRVQGVGYRAFVADEAERHGVEGWVRNRRDGTVEALLVASAETLVEMMAACRNGPPGARVDGIDDRAGRPDELTQRTTGERFSVLPTV